jgi:hypothetical protein
MNCNHCGNWFNTPCEQEVINNELVEAKCSKCGGWTTYFKEDLLFNRITQEIILS